MSLDEVRNQTMIFNTLVSSQTLDDRRNVTAYKPSCYYAMLLAVR